VKKEKTMRLHERVEQLTENANPDNNCTSSWEARASPVVRD